jgi:hypothetical protein
MPYPYERKVQPVSGSTAEHADREKPRHGSLVLGIKELIQIFASGSAVRGLNWGAKFPVNIIPQLSRILGRICQEYRPRIVGFLVNL